MIRVFHPPGLLRLFFPGIIWRLPEGRDEVLLTFDDGPVPGATDWILDTLGQYGIKAIFFCLGKQAEAHPELMERIRREGHLTGNHSYSHPDGWRTPFQAYREDIMKADEQIGSPLFRPPYGRLSFRQYRWVKKHFRLILWSGLVYDFDDRLTNDQLRASLEPEVRKGNILVFHDRVYLDMGRKDLLIDVLEMLKRRKGGDPFSIPDLFP